MFAFLSLDEMSRAIMLFCYGKMIYTASAFMIFLFVVSKGNHSFVDIVYAKIVALQMLIIKS